MKLFIFLMLLPFTLLAECSECKQFDKIIFDCRIRYNASAHYFWYKPILFEELDKDGSGREKAIFFAGCIYAIDTMLEHRTIELWHTEY